MPGGAPGQVGWGPGQPDLVRGSPTYGRGVGTGWFKVPSNPSHATLRLPSVRQCLCTTDKRRVSWLSAMSSREDVRSIDHSHTWSFCWPVFIGFFPSQLPGNPPSSMPSPLPEWLLQWPGLAPRARPPSAAVTLVTRDLQGKAGMGRLQWGRGVWEHGVAGIRRCPREQTRRSVSHEQAQQWSWKDRKDIWFYLSWSPMLISYLQGELTGVIKQKSGLLYVVKWWYVSQNGSLLGGDQWIPVPGLKVNSPTQM